MNTILNFEYMICLLSFFYHCTFLFLYYTYIMSMLLLTCLSYPIDPGFLEGRDHVLFFIHEVLW